MSGLTSFATPSSRPLPEEHASACRLAVLDVIKAFALLWICLVHWTERVFGPGYIANPSNEWPPLAERISQLNPFSGHGIWDIPLSLLLGFGRAGDQGVQLFLIVSGFGLTWAMLHGKSVEMPSAHGTFKRAQRVEEEAGEQGTLGL